MKVLLIGGNGQLGRSLKNFLRGDVYTFGKSNISSDKHIVGDLLVEEEVKNAMKGFDLVVNLVGLSPLKEPKEVSYSKAHVFGVRNILFNLKKKQRFVHISALGASENSDIEYIRTKGKAESLILSSGVNAMIIRPSIIFEKGFEIFNMFEHNFLVPNFDMKIQPVHPKDIANLINNFKKGVFDCCGLEVYSFYEFIKMYRGAKRKVSIKVPLWLVKPVLFIISRLNLFGFSKNQYLSLSLNNTSSNNFVKKGVSYKDWLQKL